MAIGALDLNRGPNFAIELRVAVIVLQEMAIDAVHSLFQVNVHQVDRHVVASFADHLGSFDGNLPTLAAGAFGGTPTPVGTVLASHGPAVPDLMVGSADPQARQQLFDAIVTELGLALRKDVTAVKLSRLTDAYGATFGLLM